MFGATPGLFTNKISAIIASSAYTLESIIPWILVSKKVYYVDKPIMWYRPCQITDIKQAESEGWKIEETIDIQKLTEIIEKELSSEKICPTEEVKKLIRENIDKLIEEWSMSKKEWLIKSVTGKWTETDKE